MTVDSDSWEYRMELSGLLEKELARPWPGQDMEQTSGLLSR